MFALPARLISAKITLYLAATLALSLVGNAYLVKRWLTEGSRCAASVAVDANASLIEQREQEIEREEVSTEIARDTDTRAAEVAQDVHSTTQADQEAVTDAHREFRPPSPPAGASVVACAPVDVDGVQDRFERARDRANGSTR
jgi:hypothetical protein